MRKLSLLIVLSTILTLTLNTALAAPPAQEPEGEPYTVQDGDWLSEIVREQGTVNEFQDGDWLSKIAEEQGESYEIQDGDWLSKLAEERYGDPQAYPIIVGATNAKAFEDSDLTIIDNPALIEVGQRIWIPDEAPLVEASAAAVGIDLLGLFGLDKPVRAINKAIRALEKQSKDWQVTLRELEADLIDAGQSTLASEVPNLIETGIATSGTEFRCNTDFVANRLRQHLENMRRHLKKEPEITLKPVICQVVPNEIDLRLEDKRLDTLKIYGYDFPTEKATTETAGLLQDSGIRAVLRDENGQEHDVTDKIAVTTGYQMNLAIGGGTALPFTETSERLIIRWEENGKEVSHEIPILQPPQPKFTRHASQGQNCLQVCTEKGLVALSLGTHPDGTNPEIEGPYYYCDFDAAGKNEGPRPGFNLGNQCYSEYGGGVFNSDKFSCACATSADDWDNEVSTSQMCDTFCASKNRQALSPGKWTGEGGTRWFYCSAVDSSGVDGWRAGFNMFNQCVVSRVYSKDNGDVEVRGVKYLRLGDFRCACGETDGELDDYLYK